MFGDSHPIVTAHAGRTWASQAMDRLEILWDHLAADIKALGYLQLDESRIKVLDSLKKGACHQGWYWVYHSPIEKTVLFDYQPTHEAPAPKRLLDDFTGYLQTDGYSVYDEIGQRKGVVHLACWAHARRAAMVYSLLGTCKLHGVNPTQWLTHVLANILQTKYDDVRSLYPQNFSQP